MPEKKFKIIRIYHSYWQSILAVSFLLTLPMQAKADAINPILNLFTPATFIPALILTVLIIIVEGLLLWRWTRPISLCLSLWRATIINLISSIAGSIVVWLFFQEQIMLWGLMDIYVSMFLLTLITEIPTLKYLYRNKGLKWKRTIKISFGLNLISYLLIFIL